MSSAMFEPDIYVPLRMPWDTICKLAVKAQCLGMSMDDVCELAIRQEVQRGLAEKPGDSK